MHQPDPNAWLWIVIIVPLFVVGVCASIVVIASGLVGIVRTSTESGQPSHCQASDGEGGRSRCSNGGSGPR